MKKVSLLGLLLMVFLTSVNAQQRAVKLNIPSLVVGNVGLNYEYFINDKSSLQATFSYLIPGSIPHAIRKPIAPRESSAPFLEILKNQKTGWSIHLEYRKYTGGNGAPYGFYWGPFLRYYDYTVKYDTKEFRSYNYNPDPSNNYYLFGYAPNQYEYYRRLGLRSRSIGVQIGYQWKIGKNFAMDWSFLGLGVNIMSAYGKYQSSGEIYPSSYHNKKVKYESSLSDLPLIGHKLKIQDYQYGVYNEPNTHKLEQRKFVWLAWRSSLKLSFFF